MYVEAGNTYPHKLANVQICEHCLRKIRMREDFLYLVKIVKSALYIIAIFAIYE